MCVKLGVSGLGHVDYQRVVRGAPLCGIYFFCGCGVGSVSSETVDRFGGEGNEAALPYDVRRLFERVFVALKKLGGKNFSLHKNFLFEI